MQIEPMRLSGLLLIKPRVFKDDRGHFYEMYQRGRFKHAGIDLEFVQDNIALSKKNTVRGLHYQEAPGQAKLVTAIEGRVWDVAVDLRPSSPTYGQWEAVELSDQNHWQLFIPVGFAHGYCVLSETARVHYKVNAPYDPAAERTVRWDDPDLRVGWPVKEPILSERDLAAPFFRSGVNK